MGRVRRSSSPHVQLQRLEKKHATLDEELTDLSQRSYLTPGEQMRAKTLKKQKLRAKDEMQRLRGD